MNPVDDHDSERPGGSDNPQRLLILAYTRLFLMPERDDGSKLISIAAFGRYEIRLIEFQDPRPGSLAPLWIELYDRVAGRTLDGAGCNDLQDAGCATETFIAEARALSGVARPDRAWDPSSRD